jgi:hypothetical protein
VLGDAESFRAMPFGSKADISRASNVSALLAKVDIANLFDNLFKLPFPLTTISALRLLLTTRLWLAMK